jgi:Lar family restriction alleviation protein
MTPAAKEGLPAVVGELVACPFCGKSVATLSNTDELSGRPDIAFMHTVVCDAHRGGCGATVGYEPDQADAIASWNRRATLSALTAEAGKGEVETLRAEVDRLNAIINTPHTDDFLQSVSIEAEHQRQRWGSDHDEGKTPADWFWLIGYLAGKALHCVMYGMDEKAMHHVVTTAAACANWHKAMKGETNMRPGIDGEAAMAGETK